MTRFDIFSNEWCDLIFKDKNKNYGAYMLRILSARRHAISLVIAIVVFVLGVSFPSIIHSITPERAEKDVSVRSLTNIKLDKPMEVVEEIIKALPPSPPFRNVIKFKAYVIKPDELVTEEDDPKLQQ